jgi:hypothetical protein
MKISFFLLFFSIIIINNCIKVRMSQYNTMSQMPSQGNASWARAGNAREGYARGPSSAAFAQGPMGRGAAAQQPACTFPAPPPARVYCTPAAFSNFSGNDYQRMSDAYGSSVPAAAYY